MKPAGRRGSRHVVIIVENLPVPLDRRVWQEARALRDAGWRVSVICPRTRRHPAKYEELEGIHIFRHSLPQARWKLGFLLEYAVALLQEFRLLARIYLTTGFDFVQACNPPDLMFVAVLPFKLLGSRFVFDHHDPWPEMFSAKFAHKGLGYHAVIMAERLTFRCADFVISTNETLRGIAISRGGKHPDRVEVVYSVPDPARTHRVQVRGERPPDHKFTIGYLGIINDQDGVDHIVRALAHLLRTRSCPNVQAVVVGDGPALPAIKALASGLSIQDHIAFLGYLTGKELLTALSTFDVGVIPDPRNEYNCNISLNKVFEYSALGIPIVGYRLDETMRLLGDAALFAERDDPASLGDAIYTLLADERLRNDLGEKARALASERFDWNREAGKYVGVYERLWQEAAKEVLGEPTAGSK
jgi:glycosyltransferase involved in cell wall biosynthesis